VEPSAVEALTLSAYDGIALQLDPNSHRLDASFPFGALSRSRFCPECLRESDGRWQLAWRLGWSFVCVMHNCVLADACPTCGKYQRQQQVYRHVPAPTLCACGESLGAVPTAKLPADDAITQAQREVFDIIDNGATHFGVFAAHRNSVRDVLVAIRSLANRVLNHASTHGLAAVRSAEVSRAIAGLPELKPLQARNALNETAPSRAIDAAVGVTAALHILRSPTVKDAADRTRPFFDGQNADTGPAELRSCPRDGVIASAIAIKARSRDMGPELQLRYRTAITMPCAPDLDADRVQSIAAALPAVMWQEWSNRLLPDPAPNFCRARRPVLRNSTHRQYGENRCRSKDFRRHGHRERPEPTVVGVVQFGLLAIDVRCTHTPERLSRRLRRPHRLSATTQS
jgi:hypothetical protein